MLKLTIDQKTILLELRRMDDLKRNINFGCAVGFVCFLYIVLLAPFLVTINSSNPIEEIISKIASNCLSKILTVLLGSLTLFHYNLNWNLYKEILQLSSKLPFEYRDFLYSNKIRFRKGTISIAALLWVHY